MSRSNRIALQAWACFARQYSVKGAARILFVHNPISTVSAVHNSSQPMELWPLSKSL